jgi:hypothetical protein
VRIEISPFNNYFSLWGLSELCCSKIAEKSKKSCQLLCQDNFKGQIPAADFDPVASLK